MEKKKERRRKKRFLWKIWKIWKKVLGSLQTRSHNLLQVYYKGVFDCFRKMYAHEGMLSYWKGILPPILAETPKRATKFVCFEQYKQLFLFGSDKATPLVGWTSYWLFFSEIISETEEWKTFAFVSLAFRRIPWPAWALALRRQSSSIHSKWWRCHCRPIVASKFKAFHLLAVVIE